MGKKKSTEELMSQVYIDDSETLTPAAMLELGLDHTEITHLASIRLSDETAPENVRVFVGLDEYLRDIELNGIDGDEHLFHNAKFDLSFLVYKLKEDGWLELRDANNVLLNMSAQDRKQAKQMFDRAFTYCVNDMGVWYSVTLFCGGNIITFRDSLKILPFSVAELGKAFETKYRKLEADYDEMFRPGEQLSKEAEDYLKNDELVVHEAMKHAYNWGLTKSTIGSCCMSDFRKDYGHGMYRTFFPDLTERECPILPDIFPNADAFCRAAYHGGYCYVKVGCEDKILRNGLTFDYNSMYPSYLLSHDGEHLYPYGYPTFWEGEIPKMPDNTVYFVAFRCFFDLKKDHLPTVQIKHHPAYNSRKWLETSRVKGSRYWFNMEGKYEALKPLQVMTCVDFELFKKHYKIEDLEIIGGCTFDCAEGFFDDYINRWADMKINAKNKVERQVAKLLLNNISGKLGASTCSNFKQFDFDDEKMLHPTVIESNEKECGYVPIAAFLTSYARRETITTAQRHYDKYCYSDTDSCHFFNVTDIHEFDDIPCDPKRFHFWKCETCWDEGVFVKAKTYIEHVTHEDFEEVKPYYNVKCAGMGKKPREYLNKWLTDGYRKTSEADEVFVEKFTLENFRAGLTVPGNLKARFIKGGTVLIDTEFKLH